jgi:hypothetical protein
MSSRPHAPYALLASTAALRSKSSILPEPFASRLAKREKRPLGDPFGLETFGVNLTRIPRPTPAARPLYSSPVARARFTRVSA